MGSSEVVVLYLMRSTDCKFCGNTIIGFEKWKNIRYTALKNMNFEQKEIWTYNPSGLPTTSEGFISFPTAACRTSIYTSICTDGKSSRTLVIGWEVIPVGKSQVLLVESEILKEHRIGLKEHRIGLNDRAARCCRVIVGNCDFKVQAMSQMSLGKYRLLTRQPHIIRNGHRSSANTHFKKVGCVAAPHSPKTLVSISRSGCRGAFWILWLAQ